MRTTLLALWPVGLALLALLCTVRSMTAAEFPAVDQLPAHAELPDPLRMLNGERITTKEDWVSKRRPELKALFQHYMYGELPPAPEKITAIVEREDRKYFDGKATKKELAITIGPGDMPKIYLLLVVPNKRKGPAPAFVGMNFHGNHALVNDPTVRIPMAWMYAGKGVKDNRATEEGRARKSTSGPWSKQLTAATPWRRFTPATSTRIGPTNVKGSSRVWKNWA